MNILNKVTWQAMWKNRTRTIVTVIGVILSAAMFMAVTTAAYSAWDFMVRGYRYEIGDFYVNFNYATKEQAQELANHEDVSHSSSLGLLGYTNQWEKVSPTGTYRVEAADEVFFETMSVPLMEGRLPQNSSEIVIPRLYNDTLAHQGKEKIQVGDSVTLDMYTLVPTDQETTVGSTAADRQFQKTYTIVGIMEDRNYVTSDESWGYYSILTLSDGNEGEILWYRLYAKTHDPADARLLRSEPYGENAYLYQNLLNLYGATNLINVNLMLVLLAAVLCLIVCTASVSLISNAFSISVSERTKEFGLLTSIGATRKQLHRSVLFEAAVIGAIGIPVGLLAGFDGIAAVLAAYGSNILRMFSFSANGAVQLNAVFSWIAALAAILICDLTILISAWIPSRKVLKITPMEAVRQNTDYQPRIKNLRGGNMARKLFGIPGMLGSKYYKVSRKKYRATVVSLSISMMLLIVTSYFGQVMTMAASTFNTHSYDFKIYSSAENRTEIYEEFRSMEGVTYSALASNNNSVIASVPSNALEQGFKDVMSDEHGYGRNYDGEWSCEQIALIYLEDDVLAQALRSQGIDPIPYLESEQPVALSVFQNFGGWYVQDDAGEWIRLMYYGSPLNGKVDTLRLYKQFPPDILSENTTVSMLTFGNSPDGHVLYIYSGVSVESNGIISPNAGGSKFTVLVEPTQEEQDGNILCRFYAYDSKTQKAIGEPLVEEYVYAPEVKLGATLETRPYAADVFSAASIDLILPLSKMPEGRYELFISIDKEYYTQILTALEEFDDGNFDFSYQDYLASEMNLRGMVTLLQALVTGFIALISLISAANVFNTISTNFALRRRDFGMLRSMGMQTRQLYRMAVFECLNYGAKALVWSLPVGLMLSYGIYYIIGFSYVTVFRFPWDTTLFGLGCILAVVFATMLYSISKLRKDNPIDAIRMENT